MSETPEQPIADTPGKSDDAPGHEDDPGLGREDAPGQEKKDEEPEQLPAEE